MNQLKIASADARLHWTWTGKAPKIGECPGIRPDGTIMSLPQVQVSASRQEIRDYFDNGWTLYELLFSSLADEAAFLYQPNAATQHPLLFYYAHPAAFYIQKLQQAGLISQNVDASLERRLTNCMLSAHLSGSIHADYQDWPSLDEIRQFRLQVYEIVVDVIERHPAIPMKNTDESPLNTPLWALFMAFEHERLHLESCAALLRTVPLEYMKRPSSWPRIYSDAPKKETSLDMVSVPPCKVILGKSASLPVFGWDNEYGLEARSVRPFSASSTLISNREFHAFVRAGGYDNISYWSEEGWLWKIATSSHMPTHWRGEWLKPRLRTLFEEIEMQWEWPVIVNYHEAKAYCAWRTDMEQDSMPYRLLTEAEHQALREINGHDANREMRYGSECPVAAMAISARGFHDVIGNVWQWVEDHFHPLSGNKPHPYYADFSAPHYHAGTHLLMGGSHTSTGGQSNVWMRMFAPAQAVMNTGFRIARYDDKNTTLDAKVMPPK